MGLERLAKAAVLGVALGSVPGGWAKPIAVAGPGQGKLNAQQKTLHALNRFTFGPRPGEAAKVSRIGVDRWFREQLRPEAIDDSVFEEKLSMFPAMRLSQAELMRRFPSPQRIRQAERQGGALPADPVERAIYADAEARYREKNKGVEAGTARAGASVDKEPMGDVGSILGLTPDARFAALIAMSPGEMESLRGSLKPSQKLRLVEGMSPEQVEAVAALQGPERVVAAEALESRLLRDIETKRQLQAVMSDFWLNHFSVYVRKDQNEPYLLPAYERETVLPRALGNFEDLLVATAKSPAMLVYLDNWESVGPNSAVAVRGKKAPGRKGLLPAPMPRGINENYARELMELHTLGVGGGYTQKDVIEVAKCFTGWTIDRPNQGGGAGFVFDPDRHEPGPKVVLGQTIHEDGMNEGLEVLHILAMSPATAHFVAQKLAVRFVSDTPAVTLVDRMAKTFLKSRGDIGAVLTTMERSREFWSPAVYRAKVKTPLEFLVSAVRAGDARVTDPLPLVQAMEKLGMPVFGMQTPNGYSWLAEEWVSSNALIGRMNVALALSGDRLPGTRTDWTGLLGDDRATPEAEKKLETLLLGQSAGETTRTAVLAPTLDQAQLAQPVQRSFSAKTAPADTGDVSGARLLTARVARKRGGRGDGFGDAGQPATALGTMAGLLLGSPDFQRR